MVTPLLRIASLDMVQDIIVSDSLHLLHQGVLKTLLSVYKDGSNYAGVDVRWSNQDLSNISRLLESVRIPVEIHRKVRPIDMFLTHWKASESATFLNYLSIVVLKDFLPANHYCNFLVFFCATTICSSDYYRDSLETADAFFHFFVENYFSLFQSATSNLHNLIHVVDEVKRFGNLNTLSAYVFENKLFLIKKLLRTGKFPLTQAANRLSEITLCNQMRSNYLENDTEFPIFKYLLENSSHNFTYVKLNKSFTLLANGKDNWFLTQDKEIISMSYAFSQKEVDGTENVAICGCRVRVKTNFFDYPIESSDLNIFASPNANSLKIPVLGKPRIYTSNDILCKLFIIQYETDNESVFVPIHHTLENKTTM